MRRASDLEVSVEAFNVGADKLTGRIGRRQHRVVAQPDDRIKTEIDIGATLNREACLSATAEIVVEQRRVVQTVAAAHDGLVVDAVSKSESRARNWNSRFDQAAIRRRRSEVCSRWADERAESAADSGICHEPVESAIFVQVFDARIRNVVTNADVQCQPLRDLDVVLREEGWLEEAEARIDRLHGGKGKLRRAGDEARDGPTLTETVAVGCLVTDEVEVAAEVKVVRVVELLPASLGAELERVPSANIVTKSVI